jgi:hypothetical protein
VTIDDKRGQELHNKATRGELLSAEEYALLTQWYAWHDQQESAALARRHPERSAPMPGADATINALPSVRLRKTSLSIISLLIWGGIGLATGAVIGGLGVDVHGAEGGGGSVVNVGVEVFGFTVHRSFGPGSIEATVWTWGLGLIGLFAYAGACLGIGLRAAAHWVWCATGSRAPILRPPATRFTPP